MFNELFQSLHEAVKKRNNPDSFVIDNNENKDVIHRGYIKKSPVPLRCDFVPDGKGTKNSGSYVYHFKDGTRSGVVTIDHKLKPTNQGHETYSTISMEMMSGRTPSDRDLFRIVFPAIRHHFSSIEPDIMELSSSIPFGNAAIEQLDGNYEISEKSKKDGSVILAKKILDPRIERIISRVNQKINSSKEN